MQNGFVEQPLRFAPPCSPASISSAPVPPPSFVARSSAFRLVLERLARLAKTPFAVLLEGESGTGKSYLAELLHEESARATRTFQIVDLGELDEGLAASDLFGHAKGAFTGATSRRTGLLASANGGTVFLDEIGKAPQSVQAKLLRVIERHEIRSLGEDRAQSLDVRFVIATSEPLDELVRQNRFLSDLRCRLQGYRIIVPPLRERRADIPELVEHFARTHSPQCGYTAGPPAFDTRVMRALVTAPWPGNLRELDQAVSKLMIEGDGAPRITCKHLCNDLEYLAELAESDDHRQRAEMEVALAQAQDNRAEAARMLSMPRSTFYRRLEKFHLNGNGTDSNEGDDTAESTA